MITSEHTPHSGLCASTKLSTKNKRTSRKVQISRILSLVLCVFLFTACSSPEENKQEYFENALQYIKQDEREAAILELRSAIQLDAKFGEARYQLGLLYLEKGESKKAFDELVRAADLLPDNLDANLKVAYFYLLSGEKEESRRRLDHILASDPNYHEALVLLANLELSEGNFDKALVELEKTGEKLDTSDDLQNLKGRIYAAQKQWDAAEAAFQTAISLDSSKFAHYKTLLHLYETRAEKEKAKTVLEKITNKFPENVEGHLIQAGYARSIGDFEKVGEELEKVVSIDPKDPRHRLQLAGFYQQIGKNDKAEEALAVAHSELDKNPDITAELAFVYFDGEKFDEARDLLKQLEEVRPGHRGTSLLQARFLLKENKAWDSIAIFQRLNKDYPEWSDPYFYLGMAHFALGEVDLAQQAVTTAIQKNGKNPNYHALMAQLFLAKGAFEDARSEALVALKSNPKDMRSALILGRALIGAKQYAQAVTILTDMKKQVPGNTAILGNLALASLGAKDTGNAEEYLTELLEIDPGHVQAVALYLGLKHKNDLSGGEAFVRQQLSKVPDDPSLYLVLGRLLEKQKKNEEALALYDKVQHLSPENTEAIISAAKLLRVLRKNEESMAMYSAMIDKDPNSIAGHMGVAAIFEAEGDAVKAMEQYENILKIKSDYAPAANNLAWLLASTPGEDLGRAFMLAMTAKQAMPEDPSVADTLGWVHYQRGSYSLAAAQFEFALQSQPDSPSTTYRLALALSDDNQKEEAVKKLEELLKSSKEFSERENAETLFATLTKE